jgi:hypothetical protein
MIVMVAVLFSTILPVTSKKRKERSASRSWRTRRRRSAPVARTAIGASRSLAPRTSLRAGNVRRTRRTAVQGAAHRRRRRRRRMVLPSPLSCKAQPLARLRAPFAAVRIAGLAVASSRPNRTIVGVRHGDTRGTATSISQMIRMPRRTWPGGHIPGVAAGSQRSKRAGRRTSRGCTARRTQN